MQTNEFEYPPVIIKLFATYRALYPLLKNFEKLSRHTLGRSLETTLIDTITLVIEANSIPLPLRDLPLRKAGAKTHMLSFLLRIAHENGEIGAEKFHLLSDNVTEIRKMLAGWVAYMNKRPLGKA